MPGYSVFGHFSRGDTINGGEQLQKKECGHFEERSAHQAKTLCINAILLEYSKEGKLSPSHIGIIIYLLLLLLLLKTLFIVGT